MSSFSTTQEVVMITVNTGRQDPYGYQDFGSSQRTVGQALIHLLSAELGFGGQVVDISDTKVVVHTSIFNYTDVSEFGGSTEEMIPLLQAVYFFLRGLNEHGSRMREQVNEQIGKIFGDEDGRVKPLFLSMAAPMMLGQARVRVAMLLSLGVTDVSDINATQGMELGDIVAIWELSQSESDMSFQEVLAAVA